MTTRTNPFAAAPALIQSWLEFSTGALLNSLEDNLVELVKIRASQINGCAACLHMHTAAARKRGETEERLYLLDAWRESPLYSARERSALGWTEALTLVSETHAPDDAYQAMQAQFTEKEQVTLTLLIATINGWNRVQVGFRGIHPVKKREAARMAKTSGHESAAAFDPLRPTLTRIAYRMLGSVADAEMSSRKHSFAGSTPTAMRYASRKPICGGW
jgi:AhpD family alkylhydroperoxidase